MKSCLPTAPLLLAVLAGCASAPSGARHSGSDGGHSASEDAEVTTADAGSDGECPPLRCDAGCTNGAVTTCELIMPDGPPWCGTAVAVTGFCPFGCNPKNHEGYCNYYAVDDAGCGASEAAISAGMLMPSGGSRAEVVSLPLPTNVRITVATSFAAACVAGSDAGVTAPTGTGGFLTLYVPLNATGTFPATGAELTLWVDGALVLDREAATSGSITVTLQNYYGYSQGTLSGTQGGTIGSYEVKFGSDVEKGTFIAPLCNACP